MGSDARPAWVASLPLAPLPACPNASVSWGEEVGSKEGDFGGNQGEGKGAHVESVKALPEFWGTFYRGGGGGCKRLTLKCSSWSGLPGRRAWRAIPFRGHQMVSFLSFRCCTTAASRGGCVCACCAYTATWPLSHSPNSSSQLLGLTLWRWERARWAHVSGPFWSGSR